MSLAGALLLTTALASPALAADTSTPFIASQLQPVVVVAQRRAQQSQKVGISITTVSGKQITENGVRKVNGLEYYVPNLQVSSQFGTGQPSFAIRGVGTDFNDYGSNNAPVVGFYINDVAYPIPSMTQGQLYDVQRVEVLRGPQGTLYGRNTTAGAINVITNKPTDHLTYGGSVETGSYGNTIAEAYVSGPVANNVRIRLAADTNQGGAWQYNRGNGQTLGNNDTKGLRGIIDWDAASNLSVELNLHWDRDQSDGTGSTLLDPRELPNGKFIPADTSVRATGWGASSGFAQEIGIGQTQKPFHNNQGFGSDLQVAYTLPFVKITSLTSLERFDRREYDALDGTSDGFADVYFSTRAAVEAEELRIASLQTDPFSWLAGAYFSHESLSEVYDSGFYDLLSPSPVTGLDLHTPYSQNVQTKSIYADGSYDITSQLKVLVGARLENEDRKISDFSSSADYSGSASGVFFASGPASQSTSYTLPSWKAELDYQLTPASLLYTSAAAGVKSGGFTTYNSHNAALSIEPFKPERLLAYELGTKNEFDDNRILINADVFYYDYHDQQILGISVNPQTGNIGTFVNAPKSHLYGAEGELDLLPIPGLRINQNLGLTAGAFDEFNDTIGSAKVNGVYVPITQSLAGHGIGAPRYTYSADVSETFDITPQFAGQVGGSFSYRDQYVSLLNTATSSYNLKPYGLLNLYASLLPSQYRWQLTIFARNVLNRKYLLSNNYFDSAIDAVGIEGEPATYGIRLSYDFK